MRSQLLKLGSRFINLDAIAYIQRVDAGLEVHFIGVAEHVLLEREEDVRVLLDLVEPNWTGSRESN